MKLPNYKDNTYFILKKLTVFLVSFLIIDYTISFKMILNINKFHVNASSRPSH